jgi:hypothetical protein
MKFSIQFIKYIFTSCYIFFLFIYLFFSFPSPVLEMAAAVISGYKLIIYFSNLNEYVNIEFVFLFRNYGFIWYLSAE